MTRDPVRAAELLDAYGVTTERIRAALTIPEPELDREAVLAVEPASDGLTRHWATSGWLAEPLRKLLTEARPDDVLHVSSGLGSGRVLTWVGDVHGVIPLEPPPGGWRLR